MSTQQIARGCIITDKNDAVTRYLRAMFSLPQNTLRNLSYDQALELGTRFGITVKTIPNNNEELGPLMHQTLSNWINMHPWLQNFDIQNPYDSIVQTFEWYINGVEPGERVTIEVDGAVKIE